MYIIIYNGGIEGKHKREWGGRNHHLNHADSRGGGAHALDHACAASRQIVEKTL